MDPYSGTVLGSVTPARWLPGWTRSLHGGWPLGHWGSNLLEICAGWTIVMVLTGLYLWWPRNRKGLGGVLYPRLREGSRVFWRDLHATVGIWVAAVVLLFLLTALPWTAFWGDRVLGTIQAWSGQHSPAGVFFSAGGHSHAVHSSATTPMAPLDAFIDNARSEGAKGRLEIRMGGGGDVQVRSQTGRSPYDVYLQMDRATGAVLRREGWAETTSIARAVALGVDLHQGSFFGRWNQVFNTLVASQPRVAFDHGFHRLVQAASQGVALATASQGDPSLAWRHDHGRGGVRADAVVRSQRCGRMAARQTGFQVRRTDDCRYRDDVVIVGAGPVGTLPRDRSRAAWHSLPRARTQARR